MKELDHTKKLLNQQHEDDLEQLCALKKQLEKKVGILSLPLSLSLSLYLFLSLFHLSKTLSFYST